MFNLFYFNRFVTGPLNIQDTGGNIGKVPEVYINNQNTPEIFHLVVYRSLSATLCLFIEGW